MVSNPHARVLVAVANVPYEPPAGGYIRVLEEDGPIGGVLPVFPHLGTEDIKGLGLGQSGSFPTVTVELLHDIKDTVPVPYKGMAYSVEGYVQDGPLAQKGLTLGFSGHHLG